MEAKLPLEIDIYAYGKTLFHAALAGTHVDNGYWVQRKRNTVLRFAHSSLFMGETCRSKQTTLDGKYSLDLSEFSDSGGSFPIRLKDGGVIGAVTVSGLPQVEDHAFIVKMLGEFLS